MLDELQNSLLIWVNSKRNAVLFLNLDEKSHTLLLLNGKFNYEIKVQHHLPISSCSRQTFPTSRQQMSKRQIHVFISHSWSYSSHYATLRSWIFDEQWRFGQASLKFHDFSVPKDNPIHKPANASALRKAIYNKIARSHVIVIPLGMYASYSNWIQKEIDGAKRGSKPILGVNPWGQQRRSSVVADAAEKTVGWNKRSVVRGIWELYHNDRS